jgi:hypothetical protein
METTQTTILDQEYPQESIRRRKLQPWWMKTFSWIFMIFIPFIPVVFVLYLFFHLKSQIALYGIETMEPLSVTGVVLSLIFLLKGAVGYGLWFEKDWAINAGILDAIIGIIVCLCVMFVFPLTGVLNSTNMNFRLEILFSGLFLYKLLQLKRQW